jgi:putative transposase
LQPDRRYLFVIDGAKALRAAIEKVFGERAEVQRCQIHKRRNVKDHLPENCQKDYDRRIRNAYAMTHYEEARAELEKIVRQLERINPSAAHSLEEGLEETLTVHRLGVGERLRRTLSSTNPIESCLSTVERVVRNVKRWREGDQSLRWTATGLLEAEKRFNRIKGYRQIGILSRRLNPLTVQQEEVNRERVA